MIDVHMQALVLSRDGIHDHHRKGVGHRLKRDLGNVLTIGDQQEAMALHSYQVDPEKINRNPFSLLGWMRKIRK